MRLIDVDVLKETINKDKIPSKIMAELMGTIIPSNKLQIEILNRACNRHISIIDEQQIVDAVPVVRCRECVQSEPCLKRNSVYCNKLHNVVMRDWFCADGERK